MQVFTQPIQVEVILEFGAMVEKSSDERKAVGDTKTIADYYKEAIYEVGHKLTGVAKVPYMDKEGKQRDGIIVYDYVHDDSFVVDADYVKMIE